MNAFIDEHRARASGVDLRHADPWNLQALATALEITDEDVRTGFCVAPSQPRSGGASYQLRYCPACRGAGFHAAWFQWRLVERCPLRLRAEHIHSSEDREESMMAEPGQ